MLNIICSFCGKTSQKDDDLFISGKTGTICGSCARNVAFVTTPNQEEDNTEEGHYETIEWQKITPQVIKKHLDKHVIGQQKAKKTLSVGVYNHYKRLAQIEAEKPYQAQYSHKQKTPIEKANILLVGKTGTGKTHLLRTIAKRLHVPFTIADATALTQAGYVGEDVENIITRLLQDANYDAYEAERGIIYIDEIDKIARKGNNTSITRDVSGEGVQQALLKVIEGAPVQVSPTGGRKHPHQKMVTIDTTHILFICGGAFEGLENIIARRLQKKPIGFQDKSNTTTHKENLLRHVKPEDLKKYGLIPELVGRLPIITHLNPHTRTTLKDILKRNILTQYKQLFAMEGKKLTLTGGAIEAILDEVEKRKVGGARALKGVLSDLFMKAMFEIPRKREQGTFKVNKKYVQEHLYLPLTQAH